METQEIEAKPKEENCPHINFDIIDSGMAVHGETRRDIGIGCKDCGLEWDIRLLSGSNGATIKLRQFGAEEYDSNVDLLKSFVAYLKEHEYSICYYDGGRRKRHDESAKGFYPVSYDEDSIGLRIDTFLKELRRRSLCS